MRSCAMRPLMSKACASRCGRKASIPFLSRVGASSKSGAVHGLGILIIRGGLTHSDSYPRFLPDCPNLRGPPDHNKSDHSGNGSYSRKPARMIAHDRFLCRRGRRFPLLAKPAVMTHGLLNRRPPPRRARLHSLPCPRSSEWEPVQFLDVRYPARLRNDAMSLLHERLYVLVAGHIVLTCLCFPMRRPVCPVFPATPGHR